MSEIEKDMSASSEPQSTPKPVQTDWVLPSFRMPRPTRVSPRLYHFTRIQNLVSVLRTGLFPRAHLEKSETPFTPNDDVRHDYRLLQGGKLCVSVGHPQVKMMKSLDSRHQFVVLEIDPSLLLEEHFWAIPTNAARKEMRLAWVRFQQEFFGKRAFETLFSENFWVDSTTEKEKFFRRPQRFFEDYPNDPQAELLFENEIPIRKIIAVHFQSMPELEEFAKSTPRLTGLSLPHFLHSPDLFSYRIDKLNWKDRWVNPVIFAEQVRKLEPKMS